MRERVVAMDVQESKLRQDHKKLLEEQGIEGFLRRIGKSNRPGEGYIRTLSIALTHLCFRNGPIESMHADITTGLTDERMKVLNKYMVDKLGLFFLLLSVEDEESLNAILAFGKQCGTDWDDPNLFGELRKHGISSERPYLMRQLLRGPEAKRGEGSSDDSDKEKPLSGWFQEHRPDEYLKPCPFCGSEILHRDARTWLAYYVSRSELGFNKDVARAAGVPGPVVSELQHYSTAPMTSKRKSQVDSIARVLNVPAEIMLSFHPEGSTVRCDSCGATAPWPVWNDRS